MTDHINKHVRITGTSKVSSDEAIKAAIAKAAHTIHGMRWFEVVDSRGIIQEGEIQYWQVTIRIGVTLDD